MSNLQKKVSEFVVKLMQESGLPCKDEMSFKSMDKGRIGFVLGRIKERFGKAIETKRLTECSNISELIKLISYVLLTHSVRYFEDFTGLKVDSPKLFFSEFSNLYFVDNEGNKIRLEDELSETFEKIVKDEFKKSEIKTYNDLLTCLVEQILTKFLN